MYPTRIYNYQVKKYEGHQVEADIDAPVDEAHNTRLHCAVQLGDKREVIKLLKKGANINVTNIYHATPLHVAVEFGHPDLIDVLLEHEAWTEAENDRGLKPLHMVLESFKQMDCLDKLLNLGAADINGLDSNGNNMLHLVINAPLPVYEKTFIVKSLIEADIKLNVKNLIGETPLHRAILLDNPKIVTILLRNGASLTIDYEDIHTFDLAVQENSTSCLHVMIKHIILKKKRGEKVDEDIMQKIQSDENFQSLFKQFEYEFKVLGIGRFY